MVILRSIKLLKGQTIFCTITQHKQFILGAICLPEIRLADDCDDENYLLCNLLELLKLMLLQNKSKQLFKQTTQL